MLPTSFASFSFFTSSFFSFSLLSGPFSCVSQSKTTVIHYLPPQKQQLYHYKPLHRFLIHDVPLSPAFTAFSFLFFILLLMRLCRATVERNMLPRYKANLNHLV